MYRYRGRGVRYLAGPNGTAGRRRRFKSGPPGRYTLNVKRPHLRVGALFVIGGYGFHSSW